VHSAQYGNAKETSRTANETVAKNDIIVTHPVVGSGPAG
jgi:hypothetical protein